MNPVNNSKYEHRPNLRRKLMVLGIDTEVGKTLVSCVLIGGLRRSGLSVGVVKPVVTGVACGGDTACPGPGGPDDPAALAQAAGAEPGASACAPYRYGPPLSPHLAARLAGETIEREEIRQAVEGVSSRADWTVIEGAGGVLTPLGDDWNMADLALALGVPVLLVTSARLGTISATMGALEALRHRGVPVVGMVVNGMPSEPDQAEQSNPAELQRVGGVPVLAVLPQVCPEVDGGVLATAAAVEQAMGRGGVDAMVDRITQAVEEGHRLRRDTVEQVLKWDRDHLWHPFTQMKDYEQEKPHPVVITGGKGCHLFDSDGNSYLDGVASLWANVHGHRHPALDRAAASQLSRVAHTTLLGLTHAPAATLARRLTRVAPEGLERVFYSDDGSTAVEVALKLALHYWQLVEGPDTRKNRFAALNRAYHGDTVGAVSLGGIDLFHQTYRPLLFPTVRVEAPYCYRCPYGETDARSCGERCSQEMEETLAREGSTIAALVLEPLVQGAGGMITSPPGYLARVRESCDRHGVLLIADEVATGFGRTGAMFACQHEGVLPDLMAVSKGISGGYLPLAATLTTEQVFRAFYGDARERKAFYHGHTYTGNPLACAVAIASLDVFEQERTLDKVAGQDGMLQRGLDRIAALPYVGEVRRRGFMVGIELVADEETREPFDPDQFVGRRVTLAARRRGVIIRPLGDVVVLMPPLAIKDRDLARLLEVVEESIAEVTGP